MSTCIIHCLQVQFGLSIHHTQLTASQTEMASAADSQQQTTQAAAIAESQQVPAAPDTDTSAVVSTQQPYLIRILLFR